MFVLGSYITGKGKPGIRLLNTLATVNDHVTKFRPTIIVTGCGLTLQVHMCPLYISLLTP